MNLALLAYEMRAAGIKSLSVELDAATVSASATNDLATLPPDAPEPEQKEPNACIEPGCTNERGGIFGGIGSERCRIHALQRAGVRT
jgi:hypothetical protein